MGTKKEAVILFADIIGSSQISNALPIQEYAEFLKQFHFACDETFRVLQNIPEYKMKTPEECEFAVKGDECCIFLHKTENNMLEVEWAIRFALALHLNWLISRHNIENARKGITPVELGIGIHQGLIYYDKFHGDTDSSEGYCIDLAKRIEGMTREGKRSKIYISEHAFLKLSNLIKFQARFSNSASSVGEWKGINTKIQVRELEHADRELFIMPARKLPEAEFRHLEFCANALPNTEWLGLIVEHLSAETSNIPGYIEDIRKSVVDNYAVSHWIRVGEDELNNKDFQRAQEHIIRALNSISQKDQGDFVAAVVLYARWHFEQGAYEESMKWSHMAIKRDKRYLPAYYYLVESLYRTGRFEECRLLSEAAKELVSSGNALPGKSSKGYFFLKNAEMLCELPEAHTEEAQMSLMKAFELDYVILNHIEQNKHLLKRFNGEELLNLTRK